MTVKKLNISWLVLGILIASTSCKNTTQDHNVPLAQADIHRPLIHFTPESNWMNDPNGMVYHAGVYHLFYQYNPDTTIWGPMHWGHATSTNLVDWQHQPIALFPDSLGTIFSGSAVFDEKNTSGLGVNGEGPLVAIFTHHNHAAEKSSNTFQTQSIAYSNDSGKTWTKYAGNPVLNNPGIRDFRDPKVIWHQPSAQWVMALATDDRITFYASKNLIDWNRLSDFGKDAGAHGGVWECPDLFPMQHEGKEYWVLIVSINPGGPNIGSATQYFIGQFDGNNFIPNSTATKWLDYGPDNYAGITWSNTGERRIFIGWMSNWEYANKLPTNGWRNAATLPREHGLKAVNGELYLTSMPVPELNDFILPKTTAITVSKQEDATPNAITLPAQVDLAFAADSDMAFTLGNNKNEKLVLRYSAANRQFTIDRSKSGETGFNANFANNSTAPRIATSDTVKLRLMIDVSAIELFADEGLTSMTAVYFPMEVFNSLSVSAANTAKILLAESKALKAVQATVKTK